MDGFSIFNADPRRDARAAYHAGNALGWLYRGNKQAATHRPLTGRLYLSKSGWLLLSVPNALVRGVYDALSASGTELPLPGAMNVPNMPKDVLNAHISVMTADEVKKVGADNITERGRTFNYSLGALKELAPQNIEGVSRLWLLQVSAPDLATLRKTYGLSPLPQNHSFHITVAIRRKNVLGCNSVSKAAGVLGLSTTLGACSHGNHKCAERQDTQETSPNHLQERPAEGNSQESEVKQADTLTALQELHAAKDHSDHKRYAHKHDILRRLMARTPQDWVVDDPKPYHKGVTHKPTNFRFHTDPTTIPPSVQAALQQVKTSAPRQGSVYADQLYNQFSLHRPWRYDFNKSFLDNAATTVQTAKTRGDNVLRGERNYQNFLANTDPHYRYQRMMKAMRNELEEPSYVDQAIERHGDQVLNVALGKRT